MSGFEINDRRGTRTPSSIYVATDSDVARMRAAGMTLPVNPVRARLTAKQVVSDIGEARASRESAANIANRAIAAEMRRKANGQRTAANMQMVLPKMRQPLGSLMDKGIPFNTQDTEELIELRRWCRIFYATHSLVPLLVDIYSTFPVQGLEFKSKDPKIDEFYTSMFMDELNYEDFLPNGLMREYYTVGEVNAFAHFNEELGTWGSEEILDPDTLRVSNSLFVEEERVQWLVKDLVDSLREASDPTTESPSERLERQYQYQMLIRHYPSIVKAAMQDDGLDMSNALVSRMVNKATWTDTRGTPVMLRCFRTLMLEESLHAAEDAVCDRLYAPMILATLGIENLGDGHPWIPDQAALDELRDDIQAAISGDFKVITHNMGLQITSVFGRESVPNLSNDYDRCSANIMQSFGIGQSLIMGGTGGGGTYASSAINREVCEQLMKNSQDKAKWHLKKRMEIIAEAQEHYDYELKGGVRKPIYREVEEYNEETGEKEIVRVPKLLIPEPQFATLNLRDEATERAFITQLKQLGVPISDGFLALNVQVDFTQELEKQAEESYAKGLAQAQAMDKLQKRLDADGLPYPAELVQFLSATLTLRQQLAQTETLDTQNKMMDQQMAQASPAGQLGLLPGTTMQPLAGAGMMQALGADPTAAGLPPGQGGDVDPEAAAESAQGLQDGAMSQPEVMTGEQPVGGMQMAASFHGPRMNGPAMAPPGGAAPDPLPESPGGDVTEVARNRSMNRPEESDEQRGSMPKVSRVVMVTEANIKDIQDITENPKIEVGQQVVLERDPMAVEVGPSSLRHSHRVSRDRVKKAVRRREILAMGNPSVAELVMDPDFWFTVQMAQFEGQIMADWPEIQAGGAPESRKILDEALEQYEDITGTEPQW